jgi:hypothetical protein
MMPYFKDNHHMLYAINEYSRTLDIFDSRRYSGSNITRGNFHGDRVEIVRVSIFVPFRSFVKILRFVMAYKIMFFVLVYRIFYSFFKQAKKFVSLMKEVYGTEEYNKTEQFHWEQFLDKCNYVSTREQGVNECGFYVLKMASTYDGEKFVEKLKNKDVSCFFIFIFFMLFYLCFFVSLIVFFYQKCVKNWKVEYMYQLMFHPKNEMVPTDWLS